MNSLPKTVTRQRRDCNLNPGPSAPESSTLTTRLSSRQGLLRFLGPFAAKFGHAGQQVMNTTFAVLVTLLVGL